MNITDRFLKRKTSQHGVHVSSPEMETLYLSFVDLSKDCRNITFGYKFHFSKKVNFQNEILLTSSNSP